MSTDQETRPRARYRFDPHTEGIFLGLGKVRLALLLVVLACGVGALYGGSLLVAAVLVTVAPILVIWTREGMPALLWIPMRLAWRLGDADRRGWSMDPELVPHADPLTAATPGVRSSAVPSAGPTTPSTTTES